jgi:hypothetical protein
VIRQMRGEWRALDAKLQPLRKEAQEVASALGDVEYQLVPRRRNRDADYLTRVARIGRTDAMSALLDRARAHADNPAEGQCVQGQSPGYGRSPQGTLAALAVGGAGALVAVGFTIWSGSKQLIAGSSLVGRGGSLTEALTQAREKVLKASGELEARPDRLVILSRESVILDLPIQDPGRCVEVRRPRSREEEVYLNRAKSLARSAAIEEGHVRNVLAERERARAGRGATSRDDSQTRASNPDSPVVPRLNLSPGNSETMHTHRG